MRLLPFILFLAACNIEPAPKKKPAAAAPVTEAVVTPRPALPDAGVPVDAPAAPVISEACMAVGVKLAQVMVDSAKDPAQKAIYERERVTVVRKAGEACTQQSWSEPARACYLGAKNGEQIKACETKFMPPPPPAPADAAIPVGPDGKPLEPGPRPKPAGTR